jgi:competence protein ComEC
MNRIGSSLAFLAALSFLSLTSPAIAKDVTPSSRVKRSVTVRSAPSQGSAKIDRLQPGQVVTVEGEQAGWFLVKLSDGRTGFVSKNWVVTIAEAEFLLAHEPLKVHVIDIGTGLAVFVEGSDFALLYDGGSQDDLADGSDNRILAYLKKVRPSLQRIDHLILSHPHKDHLELLPDVFDKFVVANVWDSGRINTTRGYCRFLKKVESEAGVKYHNALASSGLHEATFNSTGCKGTVRIPQSTQMSALPVRLGKGAQMTLLHRDAHPHSDANGNSVVVRLDLGQKRILLSGDAEGGERKLPTNLPDTKSIEGLLLSRSAAELPSDVLIVGHHGSLTSSRAAFLDAVRASTFVISSGPHPYSSKVLPDTEIVTELERRGTLLRTDRDDEACAANPRKIGPDTDESPGGCDNIVITVKADGSLTARYDNATD